MTDAVNPHAYRSGTKSALFQMANGTCYFPECETPTLVFVKPGQPSVNVHVAHIEGAEPGSPRYNDTMTNEERRSFPNLLLLCIPHHDLVDKKEPDQFTVEILKKWKAARETVTTGVDAAELRALDDETLLAALEDVVRAAKPLREASVEVRRATILEDGHALLTPFETSNLTFGIQVKEAVAVVVRSTGDLPVFVHGLSIRCRLDEIPDSETKLAGRNDYTSNPELPARIDAGDSKTWLTAISTFQIMCSGIAATGHRITHFQYDVDLGTGEVLKSDVIEIGVLSAYE